MKLTPPTAALPRIAARLTLLSQIASAAAIVVGCAVLFGWSLHVDILKRVAPGLTAMNPITAFAAIFAGVSLALITCVPTRASAVLTARLLSSSVITFGVAKLLQVALGAHFGIDQILFRAQLDAEKLPNRMAPNTALILTLVGLALLLRSSGPPPSKRASVSAGLSIIASLGSLLSIIGYAYGIHSLYGIGPFVPMALHTAWTFFLLSLGLLAACLNHETSLITSSSPGGVMVRRLAPMAVAIPLAIGWVRLMGERLGLYNTQFGVALFAIATTATFLILIWRSAIVLHRADAERKKIERQLQATYEQLSDALSDLTKSHEELKAAQLQLVEAEKMQSVGRLAAGVAHEVKNPLNILQMGIHCLEGDVDAANEVTTLVLKEMSDAIHRANMVVSELLAFASPGERNMEKQQINRVVEQALLLVKHEVNSAQVTIVTQLGDSLPPCEVDANKIQQVLINLLINACHAMPAGGTLSVATRATLIDAQIAVAAGGNRSGVRLREGDAAVEVEISDTGDGILPENLSRIFDPFFTTKPTGKGTGLGLTVSKRIVELHGGKLDVSNREAGGATARILLPAAK